jgi:N-formylglutamate deformylase
VTDGFRIEAGSLPLLVSIPHDGRRIPAEIAVTMTDAGRAIPDTDWHVARLYAFVRDLGAWTIRAEYSRYVVDLNRPPDGAELYAGRFGTGLCPLQTFAGDDIYLEDAAVDTAARTATYWRPYHDALSELLAELRARFGYALLWDAHSIVSRVPQLFDGMLPALNIGTWDGRSCEARMSAAVVACAEAGPYDAVLNGRFKGGYITRHYGSPAGGVHAIQLEIAQRTYMDEAAHRYDGTKASGLRDTLTGMLHAFLDTATELARE